MSNVIIHPPLPLFIWYLLCDLLRETTYNFIDMLKYFMARVEEKKASSAVSNLVLFVQRHEGCQETIGW